MLDDLLVEFQWNGIMYIGIGDKPYPPRTVIIIWGRLPDFLFRV